MSRKVRIDMFLFSFNRYARLVSPQGTVETASLGFSLWTFFIPWLYPIIKGEWIFGIAMMLLTSGSEYTRYYYMVLIIRFIAAMFFNKIHVKNLLRKGYIPATANDEATLNSEGFDIKGNFQDNYTGSYSQSNYSSNNYYSNSGNSSTRSNYSSSSNSSTEEEYDEKSWEEEKSEAIDAEYTDN